MEKMEQKKFAKGSKRVVACLLTMVLCSASFGILKEGGEAFALPSEPESSTSASSEKYIVVFEPPQMRSLGVLSFSADPAGEVKDRLREQTRESYSLIDGALVEMTREEALDLAQEPGVAFVEPDYPVYALSQTVPWGIERVFEQETFPFPAWVMGSGQGVSVAVLDTGVNGSHEDLPTLAGGITTVDSSDWRVDGNGHGTHVAGTIAAQINAFGAVGGAPSVDLYSIKVLNNSGNGSISTILAGVQWAVDHGVDIISMSLGTTQYSQAFKDICDAAYASGHLLVAAAGNSGNPSGTGSNMEYPAKFESVIAVGATDSGDRRATFSSTGAWLEVMAPGVDIYSTSIDTTLNAQVNVNEKDYYSKILAGSGIGDVSAVVVPCGEALDTLVVEGILADRGIVPGSDWIALIDRGTSTFSEKVSLIMGLGARGAIIADNNVSNPAIPGDFTLYATPEDESRDWIPTTVVSYDAGLSIKSDLTAGESGEAEGTGVIGHVRVGYNPYKSLSGTSMATPHVAAAAAVLWSVEPTLTNEEIRQVLRDTALDLGLPAEQQGYGLIQLNMALDRAEDIVEDRALDLMRLEHNPGTVEAELALCVLPDTRGTVYFALYDGGGRFLTCRTYPVEVTGYRQVLSVSADYDAGHMPVKAKAFFVEAGMLPLGLQLEAILP